MLVSKDDSSIVLYDLCGSLNNRHLNLLKMVNSGSLEGMLNLYRRIYRVSYYISCLMLS